MRDEFDTQLTAALQDVPVPEGLAGRLLERLAADALADRNVCPTHQAASHSRPWLLAGGGLLAVAAGLLIAVWLGPAQRENRPSEQIVLDEAIQSFDMGPKNSGRLSSKEAAPAEYPLSRMVSVAGGVKWHPVNGFLGRRGVVYDLPGPANARAVLYVVERPIEDLGTAPARRPFTTRSCCVSAWQEGGLMYVLVVEGDRKTYDRYLNLPRSPVA
jgi:hypothetical protein